MDNGIDHAIAFPHDFPIGEAQHAIASRIQIRRSLSIVSDRRIGAMLIAVQLYNEFGAMTAKIGDEFAKGYLATEMETCMLELAKARPKDAFRIRRVLPQHSGK